jgi:hypothetical protein
MATEHARLRANAVGGHFAAPQIAAEPGLCCGLGWLATKGVRVDGWLLGQVGSVLTALSHAQELFDGYGNALPSEFAPRADLQDSLGGALL